MKKKELYSEITSTLMDMFDHSDSYSLKIEGGNIYLFTKYEKKEYRIIKFEIGEYDEVGDIFWNIMKYILKRVYLVEHLEFSIYDIKNIIDKVENLDEDTKNKIISEFLKENKKDELWGLALKLDHTRDELLEYYPELGESNE